MDSTTNHTEVLDLTHHDHDHTHHVRAHAHAHNHDLAQRRTGFLASRYDGATRTGERQKLAGILDGRSSVTPKKRARTDSVLDTEQLRSNKKRKVFTSECRTAKASFNSTDSSPLTNRKAARPSSTPCTPPPSRHSRVQHKKDVCSAIRAPRGPSRYAIAAREALRSSGSPRPAFVIISDDEPTTPPQAASAALQQSVGLEEKRSSTFDESEGFANRGFWETDAIALRSDDVFGPKVLPATVSAAVEGGVVASTETYNDSDEGYFLPGDVLSQGSSSQAAASTSSATHPSNQAQAPTRFQAPTQAQAPTHFQTLTQAFPPADSPVTHTTSQTAPATRPFVESTLIGPPLPPPPHPNLGTPITGNAAFTTLQRTHGKQSHDGLPQFPHTFLHPATIEELQKILPGFLTMLQNFEQRMAEQFRFVREEHDVLAGRIDEVAAAMGGA